MGIISFGLNRRSAQPPPRSPLAGVVSLVGAGPGDPGLLTLRAAERLRQADVIYHDALVTAGILELAGAAQRIPVGRRRGRVTLELEAVADLMAREAGRGRHVVRLKGGDPFVFGRGGEEALALFERGVPFEIVPGVTSGVAVPAAAGIPVTHRGVAGSVAFVTAHDLDAGSGSRSVRTRIAHLAQGADTLVLFMAGAELSRVRDTLLEAGLERSLPAAVIEDGTRDGQKVAAGTLDGLPALAAEAGSGPLLVVIGQVVDLRHVIGCAVAAHGGDSSIDTWETNERRAAWSAQAT